MIKNILVSMEYEIKEYYNKDYKKWDIFIDELTDILDYYKSSIYKAGKLITNKQIGQKVNREIEFTKIDNKFISQYDLDGFINKLRQAIISCCDNLSKDELYDQVITIIIGECIILFKSAQTNECKNLGIEKIKLLSDDIYSCEKCKINSKFIYSVDDFDKTLIHPYCKLSILPISNNSTNIKTSVAEFVNVPQIFVPNIKNITMKLTIQLKKFITHKKFIFGDFVGIKFNDDIIEISIKLIDKINIEEIIIRGLLKDKLLQEITTWWEDSYNIHKDSKSIGDGCVIYSNGFINNISQSSYNEYFTQSFIKYIIHPNELKQIDEPAYNQLKQILNKEFIKG